MGVGSAVREGLGRTSVGAGSPGSAVFPGFARADGDALPGADGSAEAEAGFPGLAFPPCRCLPSAAPPSYPPPRPDTTATPSGARPSRCPAECAGLPGPESSPTLTQPEAAARAIAVAARRTGTDKGRTAATSEGGVKKSTCPTPTAHKRTRDPPDGPLAAQP